MFCIKSLNALYDAYKNPTAVGQLENMLMLTTPSSYDALLYQNELDWYDVLPFDSEQAMKQFVTDHTQN